MVVLNLDENGVIPCSLPKTDEELLLRRRSVETQTDLNDFAERQQKLMEHFIVLTGEMSAHLNATSRWDLFVQYRGAREKPLRTAFVTTEVKALPCFVFVGHGYVKHAGSQ